MKTKIKACKMKVYTITQQQIDELKKHIKEENEIAARVILDLIEARGGKSYADWRP